MTTSGSQPYYGKYRGTVVNNIDPMQLGRIMVDRARRRRHHAVDLGDAVRADRRQADGHVHGAADRRRASGSQFEEGDPDRPVWTGGWWGIAAEVPALALAGVPGDPEHRAADDAAEHRSCISDLPGPTGGIMLKSTTGATIIVNDTGIYIQNGKGASIVMAGPTVTINNGALVVT